MLTLTVRAQTSTSPDQVILLAGTDFSSRRPKIWSNVNKRRLEVHERGATYAVVTERATGTSRRSPGNAAVTSGRILAQSGRR